MPGEGTHYGLTPRQADLLRFVSSYIAASGGIAPTFIECRDALGLFSKSGIHRLMDGLEERGAIQRIRGRERAIEVLRPVPPSTAPDGAPLIFIPASAFAGRGRGQVATTAPAISCHVPVAHDALNTGSSQPHHA